MERELNRLENQLAQQAAALAQLKSANAALTRQISTRDSTIAHLTQRLGDDCPPRWDPHPDILKMLEGKLATLTWGQLEWQTLVDTQREHISVIEKELAISRRTEAILKHEIARLKDWQSEQESSVVREEKQFLLKELRQSLDEKCRLAEVNRELKDKLTQIQNKYQKEVSRIMEQMKKVVKQVEQDQQQQLSKNVQIAKFVSLLQEENAALRAELEEKNQHILIAMQGTKMTVDQRADLHTIQNLRKELRRKGKTILEMVGKIEELQEAKNKFDQLNEFFEKNYQDYSQISEEYERLKRESTLNKKLLAEAEDKIKKLEQILREENEKLVELLVENQACHCLLYQVRGKSNLFKKDVMEKVGLFLKELERRRNGDSWRDVTQLVEVNQRLRMAVMDDYI